MQLGLATFHLAAMLRTSLCMELRRMRTWIFTAVFLFLVWALYWGGMGFAGMRASGVKLATNSDFAVAAVLGAFSFMLMHLTATMCGDGVIEDQRLGVAPLLGATPLERRTYLLGRFLGNWLALLAIYAIFVLALFVGQFFPPDADKLTLPVRVAPYVRFGFLFVVVPTFFVGALSFCLGTLTGSMKIVYGVVTALLVLWYLVLNWVGDRDLRWMVVLDPSAMEWLGERVAKSRGNAYLNENPIQLDRLFWLNRAGVVAIGAAALWITLMRYRPEGAGRAAAAARKASSGRRILAWLQGSQRAVSDKYTVWSSAARVPSAKPAPLGPARNWAQLIASVKTEFLLLWRERGLLVMVPLIMLLCGVSVESFAGPFRVPIYPVSSEFATQMVAPLFLLLAGTVIFYTGELFFRDEKSGVRPIVYSAPIASWTLLAAKWIAMTSLAVSIWALTVLTALVSQWIKWKRIDGGSYFELAPYLEVGARVVLPGLVIMVTLALVINVLVRSRAVAYFACLALAGVYLALLVKGRRSLLFNPLQLGHWNYSDLTGLTPYSERMALHHAYWGCMCASLFALACALFDRSAGTWRARLGGLTRGGARLGAALGLLALAGAAVAGLRIHERGNELGTRQVRERLALEREAKYLEQFGAPRLAPVSVALELDLDPGSGTLHASGKLDLINPYDQPIAQAVFTAAEPLQIERFLLQGATQAPRRDGPLVLVDLAEPIAPLEHRQLDFAWSGPVQVGFPGNGGSQGTLLLSGAVFLSSYEPWLMPGMGVPAELFLLERNRRHEHGLGPLNLLPNARDQTHVPSLFGVDRPYQFQAAIRAPSRFEVLCVGALVSKEVRGETTHWNWRSHSEVRAFAVQAYPFQVARSGQDEVYFHAGHSYNLPTVLQALEDGRAHFARDFGPYPHAALRIAEFPRTASFAQSFPTLMPYSEAIGFLTHHGRDRRKINATYFVTAHEVAHQWWGYILHPGASQGGQFLCESLAEYSASVLIDRRFGEDAFLAFLQEEEDNYLRGRDPDLEPALAEVGLDASTSQVVWYQKGALVMHALEEQFGREVVLEALRAFVDQWRAPPTSGVRHATLADLWAKMRERVLSARSSAGPDLDRFFETWFQRVSMPDAAIQGQPLVRQDGGQWFVDFEVTNLGVGKVPVRVEAFPGMWRASERLLATDGALVPLATGPSVTLLAEPGVISRGTIQCSAPPRWIVVDRRMATIDFDRTNNAVELSPREDANSPGT